jgi:hypothetical protein
VVTVDVDPEAWDMNYGTGTDPKTVRDDVREYVFHTVHEQLRNVDVLTEGA